MIKSTITSRNSTTQVTALADLFAGQAEFARELNKGLKEIDAPSSAMKMLSALATNMEKMATVDRRNIIQSYQHSEPLDAKNIFLAACNNHLALAEALNRTASEKDFKKLEETPKLRTLFLALTRQHDKVARTIGMELPKLTNGESDNPVTRTERFQYLTAGSIRVATDAAVFFSVAALTNLMSLSTMATCLTELHTQGMGDKIAKQLCDPTHKWPEVKYATHLMTGKNAPHTRDNRDKLIPEVCVTKSPIR